MDKTAAPAARSAVNWFEIAVADMDRACRFYETVLGQKLRREEFHGTAMAVFPAADPGVGGALLHRAGALPGPGGSLVYLDTARQLDACIARVAGAGGAVVVPHTSIGEMGAFALVRDTEGNVVGLHSEA